MKSPDGRKNGASQRSEGPVLTIVTRLSWQQLLGLLLFPIALWLLWRLWVVVGLFLLATLVAVGLDPAVVRLEARGLSRASAVLGVYAVIVIALGGLGYVVGRILATQVRSLMATLPLLVTRWQATLEVGLSSGRSGSVPSWLAGLSMRAAGYAGLAVQGVLAGLLVLLIAFYAVQQIEDKALVPRLQSHTTGLHPLIVILSTLVLGTLFGLLGVVLAVPLAAMVQALLVCVTSCFLHPEGAAAWLAERRPDFSVGGTEGKLETAVGMEGVRE